MNELVYKSGKGTPVTNSLLVAQKFEKNHKNVIQSIKNIISSAENSAQYYHLTSYKDSSGKSNPMYIMNEMGFSILALGFTGEKAMKFKVEFVEQFFRMRTAITNMVILPNFNNPIEAARAWANEAEQKQIAQEKIKELEPKAFFADAVSGSDDGILIGKLANILKQNGVDMGQNRLFAWMRENGFLCNSGERYNTPTQKAMELGLFEIKETTILSADGKNHLSITTKVTGKGQQYFLKRFRKIAA